MSANPQTPKRPTAVVMNMFYTGLGIARSLGEHGIPVIGLSAQRGVYGNHTRYARVVFTPDSRREPEALLKRLLQLGREIGSRSILFPTRDDDVVFLDRFRSQLEPFFSLVVAENSVLQACLDKAETTLWAERAGIPTPKCWLIQDKADFERALPDLKYPCVLKPVEAHEWRAADNWKLVGARKAIGITTKEELIAEYATIAGASERVLIQEMIPGGDDCLIIAACYMDRKSDYRAGFNTQKLLQVPVGFGTGAVVQSADRPELLERSAKLLQFMKYTGIAEVEYKWDSVKNDYQLIEINPRPWDQHRLGAACGVDLMYHAYCDFAGVDAAPPQVRSVGHKWIAEDTYFTALLRSLWRRDGNLRQLFSLARGRRIYAIWSWKDPLPMLLYVTRFFGQLAGDMMRAQRGRFWGKAKPEGVAYERQLEK